MISSRTIQISGLNLAENPGILLISSNMGVSPDPYSTAAFPAPPFLVVFKFLSIGDVEYLRSFPSLVLARGSFFGQSNYPDCAHFSVLLLLI
jgi:hypothetical protein